MTCWRSWPIGCNVAELRLTMFGCLRIERGGVPLRAKTRKAEALLVYLALNESALRDDLAALLVDGASLSQRRATLRRHLAALRKAVGAEQLLAQGDRLAVAEVRVDVLDFQRQLASLGGEHGQRLPRDQRQAGELAAALPQDGARFLQGFSPRQCSGFEHWRSSMAAQLATQVQEALEGLAAWHAQRHDLSEALAWNRRLLRTAPLSESAHCQRMELLARAGRRAEALAHYALLSGRLDAELGALPSAATVELRARILSERSLEPAVGRTAQAHPCACAERFPHQRQLLGRDRQLDEAVARLRDPTCRWLTIKGPGGIGKTAFAAALGRRMGDDFSAGVHWLDPAQRTSGSRPSQWLREHFQLADNDRLRGLRKKQLLVVVDELWAQTGEARALWACLADLPQVKVVATARERLRCQAEWTLELAGLETAAATSLFQLHASRSSDRAQHDPALIEALCARLSGHPLALELCAGWTDQLPIADILAQLELPEDFPTSRDTQRPDRHRSLRAVFEESWRQLSVPDQECLRKLAQLDGDFSASELLDIDSERILALRDASLLTRVAGRRLCVDPGARRFLRRPRP